MTLEFLPKALEDFRQLKKWNPEIADRVKAVLKDVLEHPESGVGSPTQLQGKYAGVWVRKISFRDSIYYAFNAEKVLVLSIVSFTSASQISDDTGIGAERLTVESFSEDEYASVLTLMEANRGKDNEPKVGIFWYNRVCNELFGVVSHRVSDYSRANASEGRITCSEMHEDIWKREFRKQKYRGDGNGPFIGAYQDKPRGRVFYNIGNGRFEVAVGKWIEEFPSAYQLILDEFNLPKDKTSIKYAIHWDIGMSWR